MTHRIFSLERLSGNELTGYGDILLSNDGCWVRFFFRFCFGIVSRWPFVLFLLFVVMQIICMCSRRTVPSTIRGRPCPCRSYIGNSSVIGRGRSCLFLFWRDGANMHSHFRTLSTPLSFGRRPVGRSYPPPPYIHTRLLVLYLRIDGRRRATGLFQIMNDCPRPTATTSIQFRLHFGGILSIRSSFVVSVSVCRECMGCFILHVA